MGVVFVIVWGLHLLLCRHCAVIVRGLCYCVCYFVGSFVVIVIFVWLLKFNNIIWNEFPEV